MSQKMSVAQFKKLQDNAPKKKSKYRNTRVTIKTFFRGRFQFISFDSIKEKDRFLVLKSLLDSGHIQDLSLQEKFRVKEATDTCAKIDYIPDFMYRDSHGNWVVEDVKGMKTEVYKIKKKLFLEKYPNLIFFER